MSAIETIRGALAQNLPTPIGIDPGRLAVWNARGGFNYQQVRAIAGAALQALNEERLMTWGDLITLTTESVFRYMNGGAVQAAEITMGKSRPTLVKGFNAAHSIDLLVFALGVGGDGRTLEDMDEASLVGSITGLATALRDQFDHDLLTRALSQAQVLLGTSGYNVGFCDGSPTSGSGGISYAPPKWNGQTFADTHNHYIGVNTSATNPDTSVAYTYEDGIGQLAKLVAEHGIPINTDFKVYCAELDSNLVRGQAHAVIPVDNINTIDRGGLTTGNIFYENGRVGAMPQSGGRYIGSINTGYGIGRFFATPRIPTAYSFLYRPGTPFAANNALGVRYRPSTGFGTRITETPDFTTTFPVKEIDVEDEYGISCGPNRTAGACMQLGAGITTYTDPTIAL